MKYEVSHGEGTFLDKNGILLNMSCFNLDWLVNPKVILDIGAWNFGDSVRFKQKWPEADVYAFELSKDNFRRFSSYAQSQGVHAYNLGISNLDGVQEYWQAEHVHGDNAQSSLLEPSQKYKDAYSHIVSHVATMQAKVSRLDTLINAGEVPSDIDVCHIDVEGFEYQVIEGFGQYRPKMIFAEFLIDGGWNLSKSFKETLDLLDRMGYNCVAEFAHDKLFILRDCL